MTVRQLLPLGIALASLADLGAQDTGPPAPLGAALWLDSGLGASGFGLAATAAVSCARENRLLSLRAIYADHLSGDGASAGWGFWCPGPSLPPRGRLVSVGALWGRIWRGKESVMALSTGLAVVRRLRISRGALVHREDSWGCAPYDEYQYTKHWHMAPGLPLEMVLATGIPYLGVALLAHANVNRERSFAGVFFCLQLGRMPWARRGSG